MSGTINKIRALVGLSEIETELAEARLVDGTVIGTDAEAFEDGVLVFVIGEDGEKMPLPSGTYELEGGKVIEIVDGEIVSMKDADSSEAVEEEMKTEVVEEEAKTEELDLSNYTTKEELMSVIETLNTEFEAKLSALETKYSEQLSKIKKLSADKSFKHNMSAKQVIDNKKAMTQLTAHERVMQILNSKR